MAIKKKDVREEVLKMAEEEGSAGFRAHVEGLVPEKVVSVDTVPELYSSGPSGSMRTITVDPGERFSEYDDKVLDADEREALAFALHWLDFFSKGSRNVEFRKGVKNFKNLFSKFQ